MKIKSAVIENDILNIYFDGEKDFKVSFRYKSFESKMNYIRSGTHFTTAFTNIQYIVTVEIKNIINPLRKIMNLDFSKTIYKIN